MIISKKIALLSIFPMTLSVASCTQFSQLASQTVGQVQEMASEEGESYQGSQNNEGAKYPDSAMIYNVCHERWLRVGYRNYTFNIEEGTYDANSEVQQGRFTQTVVANHQVSQAATCELSYRNTGSSCNTGTKKRLSYGRTIEGFFDRWEKNPSLYQSCHPVLGYPTGYGHTYGSGERRIDSSKWLLISSVIPRRSSQVSLQNKNNGRNALSSAESRIASPIRVKNEAGAIGKKQYASITDIDIKLLSSKVVKEKQHSILLSRFDVTNKTDLSALLGIKGWIVDKNYKRYPLSIDGKKIKSGEDSQIYTMKVDAHTQTTVSYKAEGMPDIPVGKRTAAMLEVMSADGVKVNLTLPNE